jgi:DNA-binding NarL/FixJ family response regulator
VSAVKTALDEGDVEFLRAYAECGGQKETAAELGLSHQTVKNRLSRIYALLQVSGGPQAIYAVFVDGRRGPP